MTVRVHPADKPDVPPLEMPDRFRHDVTYFCSQPGDPGTPDSLAAGHWWIGRDDARRTYDEGVIRVVSPLDSSTTAELEITEEHEIWLEWMIEHDVEQIWME